MDCDTARPLLFEYQRGRLAPALRTSLEAHLAGCALCARADAVEEALTEALEHRLPQHPASLALKRRLAERWAEPAAPSVPTPTRWRPARRTTGGLAVAALALLALFPVGRWSVRRMANEESAHLVGEAVNDHLRVLASDRALDVQSSEMHQVRPWFAGRLDFAPVVGFGGDADFPLQGGGIGYFLDRRAATFVYRRRLHTASLLVFRSDGLPWPLTGWAHMGPVDAHVRRVRGLNVVLWRTADLGYALVSDLNLTELEQLGTRLAGSP